MNNTRGFEKFIKPEIKGAKKKEAIRQEKRRIKKEITEKRWQREDELRRQRSDNRSTGQQTGDRGREARRGFRDDAGSGPNYSSRNSQRGNASQKFSSNTESSGTRRGFRDAGSGSNYPSRNPQRGNANQKFSSNAESNDTRRSNRNFKPEDKPFKQKTSDSRPFVPDDVTMPLNKFIAYCGVCGRREAAELVKEGVVAVNGDIIYEPGFKVRGNEDVKLRGKKIFLQHNLVYILLNKPKDYLTTAKDPEGRKTVYDLIGRATKERVYSVGRLDRNTTGVLLLTNDGELAQKLTHPSYQIKKIYEVTLDKPLTKHDMEQVLNGITLDDGFIKADAVGFADAKDKKVIGIEIHSGRNRIVRRIFEHLGYDVRNLDRVMFANLTKKNVERGKWRMLTEKEIRLLKHMNQSFVRKDKNEI